MKTKFVEYSIVCDNCGLDSVTVKPFVDSGDGWRVRSEEGFRDLYKLAKSHGWIISRGRHLCPLCVYNVKPDAWGSYWMPKELRDKIYPVDSKE